MQVTNCKEAAVSFLKLTASGNIREAYEKYISRDFRHHNPYFPGDRTSLLEAMEENHQKFPNKVLEVKLVLEEGNCVSVLSHVKLTPEDKGLALVHFFRFENEKVVELWDLGQEVPEKSTNENGMF